MRYYGRWMRDEAERRIGHLYPKVTLPEEHGGGEATVIAWLWARTVKCPNPACGAEMPLVRSFELSTKKGKQAWVEPVVDAAAKAARFKVRTGPGSPPEGTVDRQGARCLACGSVSPLPYVRDQAQQGLLSVRLLAIVAQGKNRRIYVDANAEQEAAADAPRAEWGPEELVTSPSHEVDRLPMYGMQRWRDAFTHRQLSALAAFSDLLPLVRERVRTDSAASAGGPANPERYADAIVTYLALAIDRAADAWSSLTSWRQSVEATRSTFARQALAMVWDYAEANPFGSACGNWDDACLAWVAEVLEKVPASDSPKVTQLDARELPEMVRPPLVSTDPPYYDNVGYADLSDYFYVWARHSLSSIYPSLFSTLLTPKTQELVAMPHRFGGNRAKAKAFFEAGLTASFERIRQVSDENYPVTVYYAFKQTETVGVDEAGSTRVASSGWETMLTALLSTGFAITGTWPVRSERGGRQIAVSGNALATSVVLVCRVRRADAPLATRREFIDSLRRELPSALKKLQHGNIAPVDLAQASIGPGMAVFSRYSKVVETSGSQMSVRSALALINQMLDEILAEQEGEFDSDTRWAIAWYEQFGSRIAGFGDAETLSKAKGTSVDGMVQAGILEAKGGKVRLLRRDELDEDWDPATDRRLTVWEMTQHLLRRLDDGELAAAALARQLGSNSQVARDLAYRLYLICERKKWSQEGQAYNALVVAWPQIQQLAANVASSSETTQEELF